MSIPTASADGKYYGRYPQGNAPLPGNPLGLNISSISYFNTEQPFIDLFKSAGRSQGGNSDGLTGWITGSSSIQDTGEAGFLALDANGYVTSLTAITTPPGGQVFTKVLCAINVGMATVAGISSPYPGGLYRFKMTGKGTISFNGDGISGATFTSTTNGDSTFTFNIPSPANGFFCQITAIPDSANYPRNFSLCLNSLASLLDAGQAFTPTFLANWSNRQGFRFMDWQMTNNRLQLANAPAVTPGISQINWNATWKYPTGQYTTYFPDGSVQQATYTCGSKLVTWPTPLGSIPVAQNGDHNGGTMYFELPAASFANRALPSQLFWSLYNGVPLEICAQYCALQGSADMYLNIPGTAPDAYAVAAAECVLNGTGMQAGYAPLPSPAKLYIEYGNEVWNYEFAVAPVAQYMGSALWPTTAFSPFEWNRNWYGMRVAQIADAVQGALGSAFSRCVIVLGAQAASTYTATDSLAAPLWTSGGGPPSAHAIGAIAIAPYMGDYLSQADTNILTAQSDGGLNYAVQLVTSNTVTGGSNPGHVFGPTVNEGALPSTGFQGLTLGWVSSYASIMSNYPGMKLICYEGGPNWLGGGAAPTGWDTLYEALYADARFSTICFNFLEGYKAIVGGGRQNMFFDFASCNPLSNGTWGIIQSAQQATSPLASAPPRYQAGVNYITSG